MSIINNVVQWTSSRRIPRTPREAASNLCRNAGFFLHVASTIATGILGLSISSECFDDHHHMTSANNSTMSLLSNSTSRLNNNSTLELAPLNSHPSIGTCLGLNFLFSSSTIVLLAGYVINRHRPTTRGPSRTLYLTAVSTQTLAILMALLGNMTGGLCSIIPNHRNICVTTASLTGSAGGLEVITAIILMTSSTVLCLTTPPLRSRNNLRMNAGIELSSISSDDSDDSTHISERVHLATAANYL